MSLISIRPKQWNQVVGQDRVVRVLHALLRHPDKMTRGYIFEGPWAVGKTSLAYLFARALMCIGDDPLGCGTCPSCKTASACLLDHETLQGHPSCTEVDATYYSGVNKARELQDRLDGDAIAAKRRVVIVDESHRLSGEAWDVFLRPLELPNSSVIFIFVTSDGTKIPKTIASRCTTLRFGKVGIEDITGMLMSTADQEHIPYKLAGLSTIAKLSEGRPRDAIKALGLVSTLGEVTPESVESVLNNDTGWIVGAVFTLLAQGKVLEAIARADELAQRVGPVQVIASMFSCYATDVYLQRALHSIFAPMHSMTSFFLKWCACKHLPADIIPLFVLELSEMRANVYCASEVEKNHQRPAVSTDTPGQDKTQKPKKVPLSNAQFKRLVEG